MANSVDTDQKPRSAASDLGHTVCSGLFVRIRRGSTVIPIPTPSKILLNPALEGQIRLRGSLCMNWVFAFNKWPKGPFVRCLPFFLSFFFFFFSIHHF